MFNSKNTKGILTIDKINQLVGEYSLWCKYIGEDIKLGKRIHSPLGDDNNPSAGFFVSKSGNILMKDFRHGTFTIWSFLKAKYNLSTIEAIKQIDRDFGLGYYSEPKVSVMAAKELIKEFKMPEGTSKKIYTKVKPWEQHELDYWKQYNISENVLKTLNIYAISKYWIQKGEELLLFSRQKDELLFDFNFGQGHHKLYRPFGEDKVKWYSNTPTSVLMGYDSIDWVGDRLLITKGMKELAILRELNYPSIALQGETSFPDTQTAKTISSRFTKIYSIMDSDEPGRKATESLKNKFGYIPIYLPISTEYKDLADLSRLKGLEYCNDLIKKQL